MNTSAKQDSIYSYLVFLVSPLLSVFIALRSYNSAWAKNLVWFFVVFYAITFTIPSEGSDAFYYKTQLETLHMKNISLKDFASNFYTTKPTGGLEKPFDDAIQPAISYAVAQFTDNYRFLYLFIGLIYGYFFSRNIWFLISALKDRIQIIHVVVILSFALIIAFWQLNSIRMWTAAHIFFYGVIMYLQKGRKLRGIFFVSISFFMHFSFLLPISTFLLYIIVGNRIKIFFYLFLATFFINEIDLGALRNILESVLPDFFHRRVETYTPGEQVQRAVKEKTWQVIYSSLALKWIILFCIAGLFFSLREKMKKYPYLFNLFAFTLLFLSIAQLSSLVPSGGRYLRIAYLFALTVTLYSLQTFPQVKLIKNASFIIVPGLLFYCLISLRIGLDSLNMGIMGNVFTLAFFGQMETSIIEFLR